MLANYIAEYEQVDEVRFVVSPQNPFKENKNLLPDGLRLDLVRRAVEGYPKFSVSDVEFSLPKPSYTFDTLSVLTRQEPDTRFALVMGGDNLSGLSQWKNIEGIMEMCDVWVYPRPGCDMTVPACWKDNIRVLQNVPMMEVSSTMIRQAMMEGKDLRYFMPKEVKDNLPREIVK